MKNFRIKCLGCDNTVQNEFQTTFEDYDGYSEYTVLDDGYLEIKCKKCGLFGSTKSGRVKNNKLRQLEITCAKCESTEWEYEDSLESESECKIICKCGNEETEW